MSPGRKGEAENHISRALQAFGLEDLRQLLEYVREWNTKPKLCHVAQFILFTVFSILAPTEIVEVYQNHPSAVYLKGSGLCILS